MFKLTKWLIKKNKKIKFKIFLVRSHKLKLVTESKLVMKFKKMYYKIMLS